MYKAKTKHIDIATTFGIRNPTITDGISSEKKRGRPIAEGRTMSPE